MNEQTRAAGAEPMQPESEASDRAQGALAQRHVHGEIMAYELDGWMVREYPGGFVERLAPVGQFRAEDFPRPHPGSTLPAQT